MQDIVQAVNTVVISTEESGRILQEREDETNLAIENLHAAIVDFYKNNAEVSATILGVDEFASVLKEKVLKINANGHEHLKKEIIDGLNNISYIVSDLQQKIQHFTNTVKSDLE